MPNFYYPIVIGESDTPNDMCSAKKKDTPSPLDGYSDLDMSFFESDDAKIVPSEETLAIAAEVEKTKKPAVIGKKKSSSNSTTVIASAPQIQDSTSIPYANSYDETNSLLRQTIMQTDVLSGEIKADLDKIRSSSTMKSKYTYVTNLTSAEVGLIGAKVQAIKEINNSITQAHNLELKRAKDIKDSQRDQQNDDSRMMDMYNAFINSPMGMYNNSLNMPTISDMLLGTNGANPQVQGVPIAANIGQADLTPEQYRMRLESNPNIEEVVMYEPSSGRRWFEVIDTSTNMPVPNYPKSDEFLLTDITIDVRTGTARNRNLDRVWKLVNTEGTTVEY